jgi:cyclopropane fatty-acyl-phospholipid synthase-like methyltransferase
MALYKKETMIVDEFIKEPIKDNTRIFYSHFGRYFYAAKVLDIQKSDTIIDCSCGNGYGTYSMAQKAAHIIGLDINEDYLQMAQKNYGSDNITFATYKDFYKTYTSVKVDKIISIETFEHVPKNEINDFIDKLLSRLKIGGSMFVTVPLGNNEPSEYNEFHCNEPSIDFIYGIFSKYFKSITMEIDQFINCFGEECQYCFLILKNKK